MRLENPQEYLALTVQDIRFSVQNLPSVQLECRLRGAGLLWNH